MIPPAVGGAADVTKATRSAVSLGFYTMKLFQYDFSVFQAQTINFGSEFLVQVLLLSRHRFRMITGS